MSEVSVYTVERNAWSIARRCEMRFRLTYERGFLPVQNCVALFSVLLRQNRSSSSRLESCSGICATGFPSCSPRRDLTSTIFPPHCHCWVQEIVFPGPPAFSCAPLQVQRQ